MTSAGNRLTILLGVLILTVFSAGSAVTMRRLTAPAPRALDRAASATTLDDLLQPIAALAVPAALVDDGLGLRAGPVAVPLELRIPSLGVHAPVTGVGITPSNVMDAPMGPADDPVWHHTFWYRGSAIPGARSTALIAGHADDPLGRGAVFARIDRLRPGDLIVVHDTRSGLDVRFAVTESRIYSLEEASDPNVLAGIYGAGPVAGTRPQPSADGLSHLTLITCAGTFTKGTHDHRLVVFALRLA